MRKPLNATTSGQVQNFDRPADIIRMPLNLHRDKFANGYVSRHCPVVVGSIEYGVDKFMNSVSAVARTVRFAFVLVYGRHSAAEKIGKQIPTVLLQASTFFSKELKFQHSTVSKFSRVYFGPHSRDPLKRGNQILGYLSNARIGEFSQGWSNAIRHRNERTVRCRVKHIEV